MWGVHLPRHCRILRAIDASPNGLTAAETAQREEIGFWTIYRNLDAAWAAGFSLYTQKIEKANCYGFIDIFKFKIPAPFTLTKSMSTYVYKDLTRFLKGTPFYDSLDPVFKKVQSTNPAQALQYLDNVQSVFDLAIKPCKYHGRFGEILNRVSQSAVENRRVEVVTMPPEHETEDPPDLWGCV